MHDVTAIQWQILVHLWHWDGLCQQRLSEMTGKDKTSITRLIDGLKKRGLVERVPCQDDRRRKLIYLTRKGKAEQKDLTALAQKTQREAQRTIDPKHMEICKDVLLQIHDNLSNR